MKITYFVRDDGACGYYRMDLPHHHVAHRANIQTARFAMGDSFEKLIEAVDGADIIVIPRMCEKKFMEMAGELQKSGHKIVVDHDDDIFSVSPYSPHYKDCGIQNIDVIMDGNVFHLWEDGRNIDLKKNQGKIDDFKRSLEMADMVTATTPILADVYRQYNNNVAVLPNCIDLDIWKRLPLQKHDEIRMGWFGGHSHYQDWTLLTNVLPEVMAKYPNLNLVIMGQWFKGTLQKLPADRVELHSWISTPAYPYKAAILDLDFAIIPLEDNEFNRCKSNIKWVEMGALSIPSVTSFVSPYKEYATDTNGIYIEDNNKDGWVQGISMMVEDIALREETGKEARKTVEEHFDIEKKYPLWNDAYTSLMNGKKIEVGERRELITIAEG